MQDAAQAVDTVGHMIAADTTAAPDTLAAAQAVVGQLVQIVADSSAQEAARDAFVGDPVRQGFAFVAFAMLIVLGLVGAVWVLGRKREKDQASLTQLGVLAFSVAISQWVWQGLAASFLGIGDFEQVNNFGQWLVGFALLGAGAVKAGATIIAREQVKAGEPIRGTKE